MDGIINVRVNGYSIVKDHNCAGAQFEGNSTKLRIVFSEDWKKYVKTVTFWNALGNEPVAVILGESGAEDVLEENPLVYLVPIPAEAMTEAGMFPFTIDGYLNGVRKRTVEDSLKVLPSRKADNAGEAQDPSPTLAEQLQAQIDNVCIKCIEVYQDEIDNLMTEGVYKIVKRETDGPQIELGIFNPYYIVVSNYYFDEGSEEKTICQVRFSDGEIHRRFYKSPLYEVEGWTEWVDIAGQDLNLRNGTGLHSLSALSCYGETGEDSVQIGYETEAPGGNALATGKQTKASANNTLTSGYNTEASKSEAAAFGNSTKAGGKAAFSSGGYTQANADYTFTAGYSNTALAKQAAVFGKSNRAGGENSFVTGLFNKALSDNQLVHGRYNVSDADGVYAEIVGNGTSSKYSNAYTLDWNGNGWFAGDVYVGEYKNKLATEGMVSTAIDKAVMSIEAGDNDIDELIDPGIYKVKDGVKNYTLIVSHFEGDEDYPTFAQYKFSPTSASWRKGSQDDAGEVFWLEWQQITGEGVFVGDFNIKIGYDGYDPSVILDGSSAEITVMKDGTEHKLTEKADKTEVTKANEEMVENIEALHERMETLTEERFDILETEMANKVNQDVILTEVENHTLVLEEHQDARLGETETLALSLPEHIGDRYRSTFSFQSGEKATSLAYGYMPLVWKGDDVTSDGRFVPEPFSTYEADIKNLGINGIRARVDKIAGYASVDVEGTILTIPDSAGKNLRDYKIYGNSVQNGDPTEESPVAIQSVGNHNEETGMYEVPVTVHGKNLMDMSEVEFYNSTLTASVNGDSITFSGTGTNQKIRYAIPVIPGETYTFSIDRIDTNCPTTMATVSGLILGTSNGPDEQGYGSVSNEKKSLTFTAQGSVVYIKCYTNYSAMDVRKTIIKPQLELGSVATEYQRYIEPETTCISLSEPLRKVGDVADYVDYANQAVVRNLVSVHPTSWSLHQTATGDKGVYSGPVLPEDVTGAPGISTHSSDVKDSMQTGAVRCGANNKRVYWCGILDLIGATTVEEFLEWYNAQEISFEVVCERVTPITEPIDLSEIKTNLYDNVITVDTEIQPSNVKVTYFKKEG